MDSSGNLFIADIGNHRIRKVDTSGNISTVAGTGSAGFSGDGGSATSAQLDKPSGVAVDSSGNIFITDQDNHRIRKVDTSGNISTVAGSGTPGFSGDGGPATSAKIQSPLRVELDPSGNLFFTDFNNRRIRKVDTSGTITTVAGTGAAGFSGDGGPATSAQLGLFPGGVAVDSSGNLFIADKSNNRIRKVETVAAAVPTHTPTPTATPTPTPTATPTPTPTPVPVVFEDISTVAGDGTFGFGDDGGPATSAQLKNPFGVAVDSAGNLFIAGNFNHRIRKVDTSGNISTVAGTGTAGFSGDGGAATSAQLDRPFGVAVDSSGNLFIADLLNNRIRKVDTSGNISTVAGTTIGFSGDGGPATSAKLNGPISVARGLLRQPLHS